MTSFHRPQPKSVCFLSNHASLALLPLQYFNVTEPRHTFGRAATCSNCSFVISRTVPSRSDDN